MKRLKNKLILFGCTLVLAACGENAISASSAQSLPAERIAGRIAGPDADKNGVRDDVDAHINTRYLVASQRNAALQLARVIQRELLVNKTDKPAIKLLTLAEDRAVNCIYLKFDRSGTNKPAAVAQDIESVTANTRERLLAYLAFSKSVNGTTGTIPEGDTCE